MENEFTSVTAHIPKSLRKAIDPILERERLTLSEYLRLALVDLRDHRGPRFEIPDESRGLNKRAGALKRAATFFG